MSTWQKLTICSLFAVLVFALNAIVPSYLNGFATAGKLNWSLEGTWSNEVSEQMLEDRASYIVFARRPIMAKSQQILARLGLPAQASFGILNFLFFILFLFLLMERGKYVSSHTYVVASGFVSLTFSNLFAFAATICTYDDFIQFVLLLLFLRYYDSRKLYLAITFFFLACVARETSLFFLIPVLMLEWLKYKQSFKNILIWMIPVVAYGMFVTILLSNEQLYASLDYLTSERFVYARKNIADIRETSMAFFLTAGIPTFWLVAKYFRRQHDGHKADFHAAFALILFNLCVAFTATFAREARYYFLPFLLFLPLIKSDVSRVVSTAFQPIANRKYRTILISIFVATIVAFVWYDPHVQGTGILFKAYALIYTVAFCLLVSEYRDSRFIVTDGQQVCQ